MILFNYVYTLPNATSGADAIAVQTITAVPFLTPLLLFFVFFVVFLGGASREKAKHDRVDYPLWATIGGLSAFMVALVMSTISGIIQLDYLIIVTIVTIFCGVWLFLDRKQSESV